MNALTTRILNSNNQFRICLLNSIANSAQVWWKWAGLAVLFSRQILNRLLESLLSGHYTSYLNRIIHTRSSDRVISEGWFSNQKFHNYTLYLTFMFRNDWKPVLIVFNQSIFNICCFIVSSWSQATRKGRKIFINFVTHKKSINIFVEVKYIWYIPGYTFFCM